jgi:hypothetical protein
VSSGVDVADGPGVSVAVGVGVGVTVGVSVAVSVAVAVSVGVGVGVAVGDPIVGVFVAVCVFDGVGVFVSVGVFVGVNVALPVGVDVVLGVDVLEGVDVFVGVCVAVRVGVGLQLTHAEIFADSCLTHISAGSCGIILMPFEQSGVPAGGGVLGVAVGVVGATCMSYCTLSGGQAPTGAVATRCIGTALCTWNGGPGVPCESLAAGMTTSR